MESRRWRFLAMVGGFALIAAVLLVRYGMVVFKGPAAVQAERTEIERGSIIDGKGRLLAVQSDLHNLAVWRPETGKPVPRNEIEALAKIIGMKPSDILDRMNSAETDFFYLKRRLSSLEAKSIGTLRDSGALSGFVLETARSRTYPQKNLLAHLLGFSGTDNRGLAGIELSWDSELMPSNAAKAGVDGILSGNQVQLTIDSSIQFEIEKLAERAVKDNKADAAMFIAMNPKTGELLAYAVAPMYDPNLYFEYPPERFTDWASQRVYEPGSVFKVYSIASLLQLGGIDDDSRFTCNGAYEREVSGQDTIRIKCMGNHGTISPEGIIKYSCNAGAGFASDTVPALDFYSALKTFGFGERTGLGVPGESTGMLRNSGTWSLRSKPTIAMGQEILVSAIQMAEAASVIANRGILMKPLAVKRVLGPDGTVLYENRPVAVRRVLSEENALKTLGYMEAGTALSGTGIRAKVADIRMAVKTGTAQMIDASTGKYSETDYVASCLAILPVEDPELILYLAIVRPKGETYFGGRTAAPLVKEAADILSTSLGLSRERLRVTSHSGQVQLKVEDEIAVADIMPDLSGKPKSALMVLFRRNDLIIKLIGDGYVWRQSPAPGEAIRAGSEIILELR